MKSWLGPYIHLVVRVAEGLGRPISMCGVVQRTVDDSRLICILGYKFPSPTAGALFVMDVSGVWLFIMNGKNQMNKIMQGGGITGQATINLQYVAIWTPVTHILNVAPRVRARRPFARSSLRRYAGCPVSRQDKHVQSARKMRCETLFR